MSLAEEFQGFKKMWVTSRARILVERSADAPPVTFTIPFPYLLKLVLYLFFGCLLTGCLMMTTFSILLSQRSMKKLELLDS